MGLKTAAGNWTRTTPRRGPDFAHKTVPARQWGHVSIAQASLRPNSKRREVGRARARMMHDMLGDIGTDPLYLNGPRDQPYYHQQWTKDAKAWLDANQKRYAAEA